jgi:CRISPR system Cascade subunit CasE
VVADSLFAAFEQSRFSCDAFLKTLPNSKERLFVWQIETKPYRPRLVEGQRLAFTLRANPVVSRKDAQGRRHRHDVVMDAKHAMDYRKMVPGERPPLSEITQEAGSWWLDDRAQ